MAQKICPNCNKEFTATSEHKIYCCELCKKEARKNRLKYSKKLDPEYYPKKICLICKKEFQLRSPYVGQRTCCYDCMPEGIQLTRGMFLAKIKEKRGGKCIRCGYDKCLKALEFHHLDPSKKDFTISNDHFKLQDAIEESKKCILLCSNCHKEFHDDLWQLDELILDKEEVESWN